MAKSSQGKWHFFSTYYYFGFKPKKPGQILICHSPSTATTVKGFASYLVPVVHQTVKCQVLWKGMKKRRKGMKITKLLEDLSVEVDDNNGLRKKVQYDEFNDILIHPGTCLLLTYFTLEREEQRSHSYCTLNRSLGVVGSRPITSLL